VILGALSSKWIPSRALNLTLGLVLATMAVVLVLG